MNHFLIGGSDCRGSSFASKCQYLVRTGIKRKPHE